MNFEKDFGWYYIDPNNKAPAWTGVEYFSRFMTREDVQPARRQEVSRQLAAIIAQEAFQHNLFIAPAS